MSGLAWPIRGWAIRIYTPPVTMAVPAAWRRFSSLFRYRLRPSAAASGDLCCTGQEPYWKLSRAWGLANLMIVHRLSDLDAVGDAGSESRGLAQGRLRGTATRILYNEPHDEATAAGKVLGLTTTQIRQLTDLAQGESFWRVNQRAFVVRHICTPDELVLFDTNARTFGN